MDHQSLLSRVRDLAAASEALDGLLRQFGTEEGPDLGFAAPQDEALQALASLLAASGKFAATSEAVRDVLAAASQALASKTRGQRAAHRALMGQARAAVVRSRGLLVPAVGSQGAARQAKAAGPAAGPPGRSPGRPLDRQAGAAGPPFRRGEGSTRGRRRPGQAGTGRAGRSGRGRPAESALLLEGFAARYDVLKEGRRQITAIHVPGDFVDLHSFL